MIGDNQVNVLDKGEVLSYSDNIITSEVYLHGIENKASLR